ncbi:MAG: OmpH family outer membrane protein [Prolixibacteraceae bacterium]|nr:OmpH family outer membrane protein [Prolixibacteraceae bacterium]
MKNVLKIVVVASLVFVSGVSFGQKFGHINLEELVALMPEMKKATDDFNKEVAGMEEQYAVFQSEYQTKMTDFVNKRDSLTQLVRDSKEEEIRTLQQRIVAYQETAPQLLQQKQVELMEPIYEKAQKAVQDVGKEKGLIYIFNVNDQLGGTVLFRSSESVDVLPLAKQKLGL